MNVYYRADSFNWDWQTVFRPFGSDVWMALGVWIVTAAIFLQIFFWIAQKYGIVTKNQPTSPTSHGFFVLQTVCSQGELLIILWSDRVSSSLLVHVFIAIF